MLHFRNIENMVAGLLARKQGERVRVWSRRGPTSPIDSRTGPHWADGRTGGRLALEDAEDLRGASRPERAVEINPFPIPVIVEMPALNRVFGAVGIEESDAFRPAASGRSDRRRDCRIDARSPSRCRTGSTNSPSGSGRRGKPPKGLIAAVAVGQGRPFRVWPGERRTPVLEAPAPRQPPQPLSPAAQLDPVAKGHN
jgi:hypothetical protein